MAAEDARYRQSSQYRLWSFSPVELATLREKSNALAKASISERMLSSNASRPASGANTPDGDATPTLPEFLTPTEEALLVTFYTSEVLRAGNHAGYRDAIKATAAVFFRRFYVTNSIMTYPPNDMVLVTLFLANKAEANFVNIGEFANKFGKKNAESILAGEFLLCQALRFAFDVKHPFRALKGAVMALRRIGGIDDKRINAAEHRAHEILCFSPLMTDAYFHYTPSQIMLAALSLADRGLVEQLIADTFHHVSPPGTSGPGTPMETGDAPPPPRRDTKSEDKATIIGAWIRDKVLGTIEACRDMLSKELPEERREHWASQDVFAAELKPLRKKLNKCRDPDRSNLLELHRRRREQARIKAETEDDDAEDRGAALADDGAVFGDAGPRDTKRRKVGKGLEDPFGGPL
ncbi:cyclin-like protein [Echria macrotheca]|uniref:Cyclin-like protein n=1 Tax=Echria macrotheca TaxID=438768 RepID=A0AAJ0FDD5_9PEZI|nr:cyclin-like protein [Echria macrotheca]